MGKEMNAPPTPNQQPEWVNNENRADLLAMHGLSTPNPVSSSTDNISYDADLRITSTVNVHPSFFEASWVANPTPDAQFIRVIPPNPDGVVICQKHGTTLRETVSFNVNGHVDVFCMACIVDLIKERLLPINQSTTTTDSTSSQEPVQRYSRYDLIKGKDATNV